MIKQTHIPTNLPEKKMYKVHSIVLIAALFGLDAGIASAEDCYPKYVAGGSYDAGSIVSATTTTSKETTDSCTSGVAGCVNSTRTVTTTASDTYNYVCKTGAASGWCSQSGYGPAGVYSASAWDMRRLPCTGTALPAPFLVPNEWESGGCPKAYSGNSDYNGGDVVSVAKTGHIMVYQCAKEPMNLFCAMAGYEPGQGLYTNEAWTALGSCNGTIAPTDSPVFVSLTNEGGCPIAFDGGEDYEEGDKISKDGLVYQCKPRPQSLHCSQTGYEPGTSIGSDEAQIVEHWKAAWSVVGYCSGTIAPTTAPVFVSLPDVGGCPEEWSAKNYEENDRISSMGLVYSCKSWPFSSHCGQMGYDPNMNSATPSAWKDAWAVVGHCSGSIAPTSAPVHDTANFIGSCPEEWESGSNTKYEEGDMVSVTLSSMPLHSVAYKCKPWPFSGHCGQFSPTENGGAMGWALAGSCAGTTGPTSSPAFNALVVDTNGCPAEWSSSKTDYKSGDLVAYSVSAHPMRRIVFRCREWPNSGYCNAGAAFTPGTQYSDMAWIVMGACDLPVGEFRAQGSGDIRSPCPAINTLANHGIINRNGREIPIMELGQALSDTFRIRLGFLVDGPIHGAIAANKTVWVDGVEVLTLDMLFGNRNIRMDGTEAEEHDSSFFREDFREDDMDNDILPSERLIQNFFESNNGTSLDPADVMLYQRNRIKESCESREAESIPRPFVEAHRSAMRAQGVVLFALGQAQGPDYNNVTSKLRSIVENERLPEKYNSYENFMFRFEEGCDSWDLLKAFNSYVAQAICEFCPPDPDFPCLPPTRPIVVPTFSMDSC